VIAVVAWQLAVFSLLAAIAAVGWGFQHGFHLMLGGLAAWVPNALFALRLVLQRGRGRESNVMAFFVGEFLKLGLTVGFLVLSVNHVPDLQWVPWLVGLVASIMTPLFVGMRAA
jgi:ATP synthase protein I